MPLAAAKAFRQQVLRPAEGVFLFHARAIERLIVEQCGERARGVSIPVLPYYLMPSADFLIGLETENPEALSVIEGLRLPPYVILLPSPSVQGLERGGFNRLRHDYWARGFEAEVARAWQMARDARGDVADFGAEALTMLIGEHAYAEVCDVLERDGVILPIWSDEIICRSFVAMIVRLRYFAPGARAFFFPAIYDWPVVDAWLEASGLDLPPPLVSQRYPALLLKSRPGTDSEPPATLPLLPIGLPYGHGDLDLQHALVAIATRQQLSAAQAAATAAQLVKPAAPTATAAALARRCAGVLSDALQVRRQSRWAVVRGWRTLSYSARWAWSWLRFIPWIERRRTRPAGAAETVTDSAGRARWLEAGMQLFEAAVVAARRAEFRHRHAQALRHWHRARTILRRLERCCGPLTAALEAALAQHEADNEEALTALLAAKFTLERQASEQLAGAIRRLASEARGDQAGAARAVLAHLERALLETRSDYYQLRPITWLQRPWRARLRQILPFQALLRMLRSLHTARARIEDLPWPIGDLQRFSQVLDLMIRRVGDRLEAQLLPRLQQALSEADFIPRNHRENVAAHKMKRELLDVIAQRRHLKFTDVRDIVARNILRLPDPTLGEFVRGDRLRRFDRTAARALPGVYRPGEIYIKGLQQLSAPLFGTRSGRVLLRHILVPFGASYVLLKSLDLLIEWLPEMLPHPRLASAAAVLLIGTVINLFVHTGIGRHVVGAAWRGGGFLARFLLSEGLHHLARWPPVAAVLDSQLMRGVARHLIKPLLIGIVPLMPIVALAVLVDEVPIQPGLWLFGMAFALGTLAHNTPAGRRFIDELITRAGLWLRRFNQALVLGFIQQLLYVFKELTRRFAQALHRVDEHLTHHLGEHPLAFLFKILLTPIWRLAESVIQFYITVLFEPQVNPIKHFPIVTIGHKILLPFLPAITKWFIVVTESFLPKLIAYPLVTLTIILLPGLFGFLVWELKENWKLYQANHPGALSRADAPARAAPIEPAVIGPHGETMRGLLYRGFHSGALPKSFERLRRVIRDELRDQLPYPKRIRAAQRRLEELEHAVRVFVDRELAFALRERCRDPGCALQRIETKDPRLATYLVELQVDLYVRPAAETMSAAELLQLQIGLALDARGILMEARVLGRHSALSPRCWAMISEDVRLFAGRAHARIVPEKLPPELRMSEEPGKLSA